MPIALSDPSGTAAELRDRGFSHASGWWNLRRDAYSLGTAPDSAALFRRVCMWAVVASRAFGGVLDLLGYLASLSLFMAILSPILTIIDLIVVGLCLAYIGQTEGSRRVMGFVVGRLHFDAFLVVCAGSHVILIFARLFFGMGSFVSPMFLLWWLLIAAAGWVASWQGDEGVSLV